MQASIATGRGYGWTLFVWPNAPDVPAWQDKAQVVLDGFPTMWDAWAFCVATLGVDPLSSSPDWARKFTLRPPEGAGREVLHQGRLFRAVERHGRPHDV